MKIKIARSIEGGEYQYVVLDSKLVDALSRHDSASRTLTYLTVRNLLNDQLIEFFKEENSICNSVFVEYGLDKYEVRAHYKFEDSSIVD